MKIIQLDHRYRNVDEAEVKLIGLYSNLNLAKAAVSRSKELPGFSEKPTGFRYSQIEMDVQFWAKGFSHNDDFRDLARPIRFLDKRGYQKKNIVGTRLVNQLPKKVYFVQFEYKLNGIDLVRLIGAFSTRKLAVEVIKKARKLPGFNSAHHKRFYLSAYELDKDHWTEGFISYYLDN